MLMATYNNHMHASHDGMGLHPAVETTNREKGSGPHILGQEDNHYHMLLVHTLARADVQIFRCGDHDN